MTTKMETNMNDELAQSLYFVSPEYKDACLNCATPGEFSSSWAILSLSHIIYAPIVSYYPPCNGRGDKVFDILNTSFGKFEKGNKVHLLWARVLCSSSKTWLPNHFMPLCKNATKIMNSTPNNSFIFEIFLNNNPANFSRKAEEGKVEFFFDNSKETEKNISFDAKVEIENLIDDDQANILLSFSDQSDSVKNKRCTLELQGDSSETSLL